MSSSDFFNDSTLRGTHIQRSGVSPNVYPLADFVKSSVLQSPTNYDVHLPSRNASAAQGSPARSEHAKSSLTPNLKDPSMHQCNSSNATTTTTSPGIAQSRTVVEKRTGGAVVSRACGKRDEREEEKEGEMDEDVYNCTWGFQAVTEALGLSDRQIGSSSQAAANGTPPGNWQHCAPPALYHAVDSGGHFSPALTPATAGQPPNGVPTTGHSPRQGKARATSNITSANDLDDEVWAIFKAPSTQTPSSERKGAITTTGSSSTPAAAAAGGSRTSARPVAPNALASTPSQLWGGASMTGKLSPASPPIQHVSHSPLTHTASPSPAMALARPLASPPMMASLLLPHGTTTNELNTSSSTGENRYSMLLLGQQYHFSSSGSPGSARAQQHSHSCLGTTVHDDYPFLLDDMWDYEASVARYSIGSPRDTVLLPHRNSDAGDRGSGETKAETGAATSSPLEEDLLGSQYFDGMLPMMLQCGEAMLKAQQRKEKRKAERRREKLLQRVRDTIAETADVRSTQRSAPSAVSGSVMKGDQSPNTRRHADNDESDVYMQDSYALDECGALIAGAQKKDTDSVKVDGAALLDLAALYANATEAELLQLLDDADRTALGMDNVSSNSNDSDDSSDGESDVFKSDNVSTTGEAVSPAMREVEELMRALDVAPLLLSFSGSPAAPPLREPTAAVEMGSTTPEESAHGYFLTSVLHSGSAQPQEHEHLPQHKDDDSGDTGSDTTEYMSVPRFASALRSCSAHATPATPPLPTWRTLYNTAAESQSGDPAAPAPAPAPRRNSRLRPTSRHVTAVEMDTAGEPVVSIPLPLVPAAAAPPSTLQTVGVPTTNSTDVGGLTTATTAGTTTTTSSVCAEAGPTTFYAEQHQRSQQQQQQQSASPTIAEMLRARSSGAIRRISPYTLLVKDEGSAQDVSLSLQRSPQGVDAWYPGTAVNAALLDLRPSLSCASPPSAASVSGGSGGEAEKEGKMSVTGGEDEWRATEKIVFSDATRSTASRTVPEMAQLVASGHNVSLVSLHARRSKPAEFTAWAPLLPEFFSAFFRVMEEQAKAPHTFSARLSVALLKCDLHRDLLSDVVRFTPVTLLGTPLLGPRLENVSAVPVATAAACLRVLREAHARLSSDDYVSGSLVVTLSLKQQELDPVSGEQRDVLLSSSTTFAANVDVYSDILQRERLPATAGLLLQLFRGPMQAAVAVYVRLLHHSFAELRRAVDVLRVLRRRQTLSPRAGSVVRLLLHIRGELKTFWAVLEASTQRAAERRKALIERAVTAARATAVAMAALSNDTPNTRALSPTASLSPPPLVIDGDNIAWEDEAYQRERAHRAQLRYALRALTCLGNDCKDVLSDPVSKLPPVYVVSRRVAAVTGMGGRGSAVPAAAAVTNTWSPRAADRGISRGGGGVGGGEVPAAGLPKRAGGDVTDVLSDGSDVAAEAELLAKNAVVTRGRSKSRPTSATRSRPGSVTDAAAAAAVEMLRVMKWVAAVPEANMFAGDTAGGWCGIRPLFRVEDPRLADAFNTHDEPVAQLAEVQTVVYLEMSDEDRARSAGLDGGRSSGSSSISASDGSAAKEAGGVAPHRRPGSSGMARGGGGAGGRNAVVGFTVNDCPVGPAKELYRMPHFRVGELCVRHPTSSISRGTSPATLENASPPPPLPPLTPTAQGSPLRLPLFSATPPSPNKSGSSTGSASATVRGALLGFLEGQNVSILSVTESSAETDAVTRLLRSPLWLAMRELVEAVFHGGNTSAGPPPQQALYLSITQPLSLDCVKDHLGSGPSASRRGSTQQHHRATSIGSLLGVSSNNVLSPPNSEEVMAFEAAWTPAGPVVSGATYIPITSVGQFYKITRELPAHVQAVAAERRTEVLGGTHVLVSFLLRRCQTPAPASPRAPTSTSVPLPSSPSPSPPPPSHPSASATSEHVFFGAATILLSTESMFWNTLQLHDFVPPSHPLNLFRPIYSHRVVNVVDVAGSAIDRAWPLLLTQERVTQHRQFLHWRVPWSVKSYTTYLGQQRDALRWCMANLVTQVTRPAPAPAPLPRTRKSPAATVAPPALPAVKGRYQIDLHQPDLPEWVNALFYGRRVWLADLAAALRQVELMFAVGVDLLESRCAQQDSTATVPADASPPCSHPLALVDSSLAYDITAPPKTFVRTPLDPMPGSAAGVQRTAAELSTATRSKAASSAPLPPPPPPPSAAATARSERGPAASPRHTPTPPGPQVERGRDGPARPQPEPVRRAISTEPCPPPRESEETETAALVRFMEAHGKGRGEGGGARLHDPTPTPDTVVLPRGPHVRSETLGFTASGPAHGPLQPRVAAFREGEEEEASPVRSLGKRLQSAPVLSARPAAMDDAPPPATRVSRATRPHHPAFAEAAAEATAPQHGHEGERAPTLPRVAVTPPSPPCHTPRRPPSTSAGVSTLLLPLPASTSSHSTNRTQDPSSSSPAGGTAASSQQQQQQESAGSPLLTPSTAAPPLQYGNTPRMLFAVDAARTTPRRPRTAEPTRGNSPPAAAAAAVMRSRRLGTAGAGPSTPRMFSRGLTLPRVTPDRGRSSVEAMGSASKSSDTPGSTFDEPLGASATLAFADSIGRPRSATSTKAVVGGVATRLHPQPPRRADSSS